MTLNEAIKHAEEVAEEQDKLCKRYDDASGYSRSHNESIRVDDAKWCEKCAKEHHQLAEWLRELKQLREQKPCEKTVTDCELSPQAWEEITTNIASLPSVASKQDSILSEARAKIEEQEKWLMQAGYNAYNVSIAFESVKRALEK